MQTPQIILSLCLRPVLAGCVASFLALSPWPAGASEPVPGLKEVRLAVPPPPKVPTHTVQRGVVRAKVQVDAVLQSGSMAPVKMQTRSLQEFTVLEAVPHGARVKKGDTLARFEVEKLREQIEDLELERPGAALALELAQAELDNLTQTTPAKLEAARRAQRIAAEDLAYFESTNRAAREKSVIFNLKASDQRVEGAREELTQLQKMYQADDLTEETEEIILKRQKFALESALYYHETARQSADQTLKTGLPREHESLKAARRDQDLAATLAQETLNRTLAKKRLDVEKQRRDQRKAEKRLADLKQDLEETTVTAPMDGIVYYGACEDGKWPSGASLAKRLIPGGKLAAREVFMTVVAPEKLTLRAVVPEADVARLKEGQEGMAAPVAASDRKVPVRLEQLGFVPQPGGGFEAVMSLGKLPGLRLMPGMNCKVTFEGSRKTEVIVVPKEMVFTDGEQKVVYLAREGAPAKRVVQLGAADERVVEIEEGLAAGDRILVRKPE